MRSDRGASLMEVLIAMLIVGLLGVAVVGGLVVVRATNDRTQAKAEMLRELAEAATDVSLRPFTPCAASPDPLYASPEPLKPAIKVEVMNSSGTWTACNGASGTASATIQRVTLTTEFGGKSYDRVLMKAKP